MTILSGQSIQRRGILTPCYPRTAEGGLTYGLGPAGYDLRLVLKNGRPMHWLNPGEFLLAAAEEYFSMPTDTLGIVHDKSSLARKGLSVFNTVIEPGWHGYLTLELINHGREPIELNAGQAIAQVVFHLLDEPTFQPYAGKYQHQEFGPQEARQ